MIYSQSGEFGKKKVIFIKTAKAGSSDCFRYYDYEYSSAIEISP